MSVFFTGTSTTGHFFTGASPSRVSNSVYINQVLLKHSHAHRGTFLWVCSLHWQSWIAVTEIIRLTKPKIFTIWPFTDKNYQNQDFFKIKWIKLLHHYLHCSANYKMKGTDAYRTSWNLLNAINFLELY